MENLPRLAQLLRQLQHVPYLASKNLYRVAHHFLEMDEGRLEQFIAVLTAAHKETVKCHTCFAWKERERDCSWCATAARDQQVICVVETWHDLCAIEKTSSYKGSYHVLGGAICPLEGIGPENLTIGALVERARNGHCREIILAVNQTPEGEATAAFIARKLEGVDGVKITCLSRGIPVGSSLEAMDRLTIFKAMAERRIF